MKLYKSIHLVYKEQDILYRTTVGTPPILREGYSGIDAVLYESLINEEMKSLLTIAGIREVVSIDFD